MARRTKNYSNPPSSQPQNEDWAIRCVCGAIEDAQTPNEAWIICDGCKMWQHNACMGISIYEDEVPASFHCEQCDPGAHKTLLESIAKGENPWEQRRKNHFKKIVEASKGAHKKGKLSFDSKSSLPDQEKAENKNIPLTEECYHYEHISEVEWDLQKYWHQRHSIFSKYDEGVYMTEAAWFSTTPEPVADKVADDIGSLVSPSKTIIIDIFGGVGGNAIAFARSGRWSQVIAVEKDPSTVACGQRNAEIYGVEDRITWVNDDCFLYMAANDSAIDKSKTVVFASPPWGGPSYGSVEIFNLDTMAPYTLDQILGLCKGMDSAVFLPRNSDMRQIARAAPEGAKVEAVQYCMKGASKGMVAYFPATELFPGLGSNM